MKRLTISIWMAMAVVCSAQQTNLLVGNLGDYGLAAQTNIAITLTLVKPNPRVINGIFVKSDPMTVYSDINGAFSFTNMNWGLYTLHVAGQFGTDWPVTVQTNTSGTVAIGSLASSSSVLPPNPATSYYTKSQVDTLLATTVPVGVITNGQTGIGLSSLNIGKSNANVEISSLSGSTNDLLRISVNGFPRLSGFNQYGALFANEIQIRNGATAMLWRNSTNRNVIGAWNDDGSISIGNAYLQGVTATSVASPLFTGDISGTSNLWKHLRPEDYGAIGVPPADDTAAWQRTEDACEFLRSYGTVAAIEAIPKVSYLITSNIVIRGSTKIIGNNHAGLTLTGNTNITFTLGTNDGFVCIPALSTGGLEGIQMEGLTFLGTLAPGKAAIVFGTTNVNSGVQSPILHNIGVRNFDKGFAFTNIDSMDCQNCWAIGCSNGVSGFNALSGMNLNTFQNFQANCFPYSMVLSGWHTLFNSCDISPIRVIGGNTTMNNCNMESASGPNVYADGGGVTLSGGNFTIKPAGVSALFSTNSATFKVHGTSLGSDGIGNGHVLTTYTVGFDTSTFEGGFPYGGGGAYLTNTFWHVEAPFTEFPVVYNGIPGATSVTPGFAIWNAGAVNQSMIDYYRRGANYYYSDRAELPDVFNNGATGNYPLAKPFIGSVSSTNFTGNGAGLTNIPSSAIVGGAITNALAVSLVWSGTNITINTAGLSNATAQLEYETTLTNNAYFAQPLNLFPGFSWLVDVRQDATGGRNVLFNTNYFKFLSGQTVLPTTNANAITTLSMKVLMGGTNVGVVVSPNWL